MAKKTVSTLFVMVLALAMCLPVFLGVGVSASAVGESSRAYPSVTITYSNGSTLKVKGVYVDGQLLVPMGDFAKSFTDATYTYDAKTKYAAVSAKGLYVTAGVGGTIVTANDRTLYGVVSNRLIDGQVWVPIQPLAKAMSLTVSYTKGAASAKVSGTYRALTHGSQFYNESELYWLARIISAESRGEPLRGQIAVGNVILNRVRSKDFPNTIYGVIFQKNQFSPVMNGTIYDTPSWTAICAAKMCLEGYSISNDVLFFCNLNITSSNWITKNRDVAFKLGNHTFFY